MALQGFIGHAKALQGLCPLSNARLTRFSSAWHPTLNSDIVTKIRKMRQTDLIIFAVVWGLVWNMQGPPDILPSNPSLAG